ncbi:MAG TPA: hypothetical protein VND64_13230 [Pirellulales bacterium]|nr:hypothetical protein [Pirellulales bacterium]
MTLSRGVLDRGLLVFRLRRPRCRSFRRISFLAIGGYRTTTRTTTQAIDFVPAPPSSEPWELLKGLISE